VHHVGLWNEFYQSGAVLSRAKKGDVTSRLDASLSTVEKCGGYAANILKNIRKLLWRFSAHQIK